MRRKGLAIIICAIIAISCITVSAVTAFAASVKRTVTFTPEGSEFLQEVVEVADGAKVSKPEGIKRAGYEVTWYNGQTPYDFNSIVTTDLTLNAKWTAAYTDEDGNEIAYDKNGITPAKVYYAGEKVAKELNGNVDNVKHEIISYNGIFDPDTQYYVYEEGSVFTLGQKTWSYMPSVGYENSIGKFFFPGYTEVGNDLSVDKDILIKFRVDPLKSCSIGSGFGKFSISIHFQEGDLHGYHAMPHADPYGIVLWGSANPNDANIYRRLSASIGGDTWTDPQIAYDDGEFAYLTIHVGDTTAESYIALNGQKFVDGSEIEGAGKTLCKGNFYGEGKDGNVHINVTAHDVPTQFQMQVKSIDKKVTFTSNTAGYTDVQQPISAENVVTLPATQNITGYDFIGYYKDSSMIIPFDASQKVYCDTTVYAKYIETGASTVNLTITGEGYPTYTVKVKQGGTLPDLSNVYVKEGFKATWTKGGVNFNPNNPLVNDTEIKVKWVEEELDLYHFQFGVKDGKKFEYKVDENYWSDDWTNYQIADTYVDKNGNTVITSTYGGQQHDDSFFTEDDFTRFVLPGIGAIMNLQKLDVSKRIVIKYAIDKNWDVLNGNNGFGVSKIIFSLYDNVLQGLKTPNPINENYDSGAKLRIETSNLLKSRYDSAYAHLQDLFGKFYVHGTGVTSRSFGYEDAQEYTIEIFISEDGAQNYLKINGETIANAIDGVKRSDFEGGYAYLHLSNYGCTNVFDALVSQDSILTVAPATNGTFTSDMPLDGKLLFKDKVTFTCTPASGYTLRCARVGDKEFLPDDDTHVSIYKGWADETVTIEFAKSCTMTFNTMGGSKVKAQTVLSGDKFFKPVNPKKSGYKFVGWYIDEACTVKYNFALIAEEDITVYAKWSNGEEAEVDNSMQPWGCGVGCGGSMGAGLTALAVLPVAATIMIIKAKKKNNKGE